MKVHKSVMFLLVVLSIGAICLTGGCSDENTIIPDENLKGNGSIVSEEPSVTDITTEEELDCNFIIVSSIDLTDNEEDMLKFVREEEKMAHDVYQVLSAKFKKPIFKNIEKSEQVHMDRVLCLLIHFNIEDPASSELGIFANQELQTMYNELIELGSGSITDALTAGATIEDFDIKDINDWIELTNNEAIISVFQSLVCGSGNHLISFSALLDGYNSEYTPQYITAIEYQEILDAGHQFCGF